MFKNDNHKTFILKPGNVSDTGHVEMKGKPNSNVDKRNKITGALIQRRKYNKDGDAYKDMDAPHVNVDFPHIHDISNGSRNEFHKPMNKKERNEYDKAQKKRRGPYVKK